MTMKGRLFSIAAVVLLLVPGSGRGDDVKDRIRRAEAEIARINRLVGDTRKEQGATLDNLKLIGTKLENRQSIVQGIETEMGTLSGDLSLKARQLVELQKRYDLLKDRYSALIRIAYKNYRHNSFLSFIFSAHDFSDAARRLYYVKRISADMERKAVELQTLAARLKSEAKALDERKSQLDGLRQQHAAELVRLEEERGQLKRTQSALKGKEKELLAEADKRRRQVAELERRLQQEVEKEVRKKSSAANAKKGTGSTQAKSDDSALTRRFEARKGALMRPVDGVMVGRYGVHDHPDQKGVKVNNKGINLAARAGSQVQCVFEGEVRKVFFFPGLGMSVMVRHGSYLTIYANLDSVFVREGERVIEGAAIGTVAKVPADQQATIHFELWKESDNLNPESWLKR
ncbi:peptidoglycan DD-metalloendopeptidase family protein [uncultured Rikenella sp.]|uniref:murein hydrolase activator EnvC family protein n=1 Tax=uncultured Rikenella sp. TaxID=368003 RepID=UPI00260325B4|nr:peptidoglycan DD-metalloendopeptidase family protein [uncultured Rikenella sp.]